MIKTLKKIFIANPTSQSMTTETEPIKDGRISINSDGKIWHTCKGIHVPDENGMVHLEPGELSSVKIFAWDSKTYGVLKGQKSFFGGRLIYWGPENWTWIDSTKEERVLARTLDKNYPELYKDSFEMCIEVPVALAKGHDDLKWVLDSNYPQRKAYEDPNRWNQDISPGPFDRVHLPGEDLPQVCLVPFGEWQTHCQECLGVTWRPDEQRHIFRKAESLGWSEGDPI